ncbi:carbohydrate kinase [Dehalococcoides mccartyi]|uniref:bifunctional ADP-dependent NAD(P)H-hydrate dehydratase/NAD(P)H-hydrate epimerase n=3 Tax=Dehalococcoides mccartyi TaxID=61435 RepID=UPI0004E03103|nr:bifunctional ADP-dependent NAD(P)H-hydrate dehydratase/NAD(P)H-hydrate epimerase [Dehalococcoides mccartyi]AII57573.1 carbohydrate kinase [Dehalococcoides mccartyi CG1]APH12061.1 carbohydrate kinase [Dehalococcoides mccartyi]
MEITTSIRMRQIEDDCQKRGISTETLMENAGRAVAVFTRHLLEQKNGSRVLILAGAGNNGGDGLVAGRYLQSWGEDVSIFKPFRDTQKNKTISDGLKLPENIFTDLTKLEECLADTDIVIDALLGTGANRPLEGIYKQALQMAAAVKSTRPEMQVLAVDLPSGLNADTGQADAACLKADFTLSLGVAKQGLFTHCGLELSGVVLVVDIGIPPGLTSDIHTHLIEKDWVRGILPVRSAHANKGSFGRVMIVAGSERYIGAAMLAGSAAMRIGAGLVNLALPQSLTGAVSAKIPEAIYLPLPEVSCGIPDSSASRLILSELGKYDVLLIGPGLGQSAYSARLVSEVLSNLPAGIKVVIDADALNILAAIPDWWLEYKFDAILTPHPGEMGRLTKTTAESVQSDRFGICRESARKWGKTIILKGAGTIISSPQGETLCNPAANPVLASAGTGDVLAGIISGLLGQGLNLFEAAGLGVNLHSAAAEALRNEMGDAGVLASDLLLKLPVIIKELKQG